MNAIRELNIKDWSGYFFEEMVNILDIDPRCFGINDTKQCRDGRIIYNICYNDKIGVPHWCTTLLSLIMIMMKIITVLLILNLKLLIICYKIKKSIFLFG